MRSIRVVVLAVAALLGLSPPASAHEVGAGRELRVTQSFGAGEVTLVIVGGAPVRVTAEAARQVRPVRVRLSLRSLTDGSVSAGNVAAGNVSAGSVRAGAPPPGGGGRAAPSRAERDAQRGEETALLEADGDGPYELTAGVGDEVSVIPFRVLAAGGAWWAGAWWTMVGDGAVLAFGLLLAGGVLAGRMPAALVGAASAAAAVAAMVMLLRPYLPPSSAPEVGAGQGRPYALGRVSTLSAGPAAGAVFTLTVRLTDGATGRPVDDLAVHHEALAHVVVTSQDGAVFRHVHPLRAAPGVLTVRLSLPRPGRYLVYSEIERQQSGGQLLTGGFEVSGTALPVSREVVVPRLSPAVPVAARPLTVEVPGRGPITPWLGMPGHLIVRSEDGGQLAHVHGTAHGASALRFTFTPPQAGRYLAWAQWREAGELVTRSFDVTVVEVAG